MGSAGLKILDLLFVKTSSKTPDCQRKRIKILVASVRSWLVVACLKNGNHITVGFVRASLHASLACKQLLHVRQTGFTVAALQPLVGTPLQYRLGACRSHQHCEMKEKMQTDLSGRDMQDGSAEMIAAVETVLEEDAEAFFDLKAFDFCGSWACWLTGLAFHLRQLQILETGVSQSSQKKTSNAYFNCFSIELCCGPVQLQSGSFQ